ncbi:oligosaccharide flippase family protein, partial [Akkermansia muciniphila]
MSSAKSFIKSSVVYFVGSVLTKVISFFLLPLHTNYLVSTDMGYYDLSVSYLNILMPVICMEIWSGIMRYMYDYDELKGKFKVVTNGITLFSVSLLLYTLIFVVLNTVKDVKSIWLIYLYGLFTMIQYVYTYIARTLGYSLIFSISGILGSLVNAVSNIIMIVGFGMRLESLYIAMILGLVVQIIILETKVKLIKNVSLKQLDSSMIGSMIRFSLPLSLNSACFWFLSSYNRIGISNILGLSMNGIYSVSGKFAVVMTLVSTCFTMAWQELVCSRGNE